LEVQRVAAGQTLMDRPILAVAEAQALMPLEAAAVVAAVEQALHKEIEILALAVAARAAE
jgi:hypothetical protein